MVEPFPITTSKGVDPSSCASSSRWCHADLRQDPYEETTITLECRDQTTTIP
eukprot:TRINITY_DN222_c0_g1_i1.p4 TRINITY_DN222_c0_g1~~TRINITY_DN222_c0_g1_i1.p4  ORF type:complete len:52 (+),score=7.90 TRINITY_DN222_c0_g1_i1:457-612(+)